MLGLYRRGRIDEGTLDQHLDMVDAEPAGWQAEIEAGTRVLFIARRPDCAALVGGGTLDNPSATARRPGSARTQAPHRGALVEKVQAETTERWGVPQSELTIFYRFSQPGDAAALVLPRSIRLTSSTRLPENLETIADHLLRRRLSLKLIQRQVSLQLAVSVSSLLNWEANRSKPTVEFMQPFSIPRLQPAAARNYLG